MASSRPTNRGGLAPRVALYGFRVVLMFAIITHALMNSYELYEVYEFML